MRVNDGRHSGDRSGLRLANLDQFHLWHLVTETTANDEIKAVIILELGSLLFVTVACIVSSPLL